MTHASKRCCRGTRTRSRRDRDQGDPDGRRWLPRAVADGTDLRRVRGCSWPPTSPASARRAGRESGSSMPSATPSGRAAGSRTGWRWPSCSRKCSRSTRTSRGARSRDQAHRCRSWGCVTDGTGRDRRHRRDRGFRTLPAGLGLRADPPRLRVRRARARCRRCRRHRRPAINAPRTPRSSRPASWGPSWTDETATTDEGSGVTRRP